MMQHPLDAPSSYLNNADKYQATRKMGQPHEAQKESIKRFFVYAKEITNMPAHPLHSTTANGLALKRLQWNMDIKLLIFIMEKSDNWAYSF